MMALDLKCSRVGKPDGEHEIHIAWWSHHRALDTIDCYRSLVTTVLFIAVAKDGRSTMHDAPSTDFRVVRLLLC